jgi:hypothetical protein
MGRSTSSGRRRRWLLGGALLLPVVCGCTGYDPVHDEQVDALGAEVAGIPKGEFHRAGQPCTVCHGPQGPASTQFSIAGTVFATSDATVGVQSVQVLLVDDIGSSPAAGSVSTNCVGNFFVTPDMWSPAFPVKVAITNGPAGAQMVGHIGREASCATCHQDPRSASSPGHVYVNAAPVPNNPSCPVSPVAGGGGTP